ncbi:hypothetical protein M885DRAFT_516340 [Pelagophyceae sp. CCMP2097]|nr:hypothetical protein M885DRAFT_516340 [Pelagophyceae sp. CCMP2097]
MSAKGAPNAVPGKLISARIDFLRRAATTAAAAGHLGTAGHLLRARSRLAPTAELGDDGLGCCARCCVPHIAGETLRVRISRRTRDSPKALRKHADRGAHARTQRVATCLRCGLVERESLAPTRLPAARGKDAADTGPAAMPEFLSLGPAERRPVPRPAHAFSKPSAPRPRLLLDTKPRKRPKNA